DLDVEAGAEILLIPKLPKSDGGVGLEAADGLQVHEIGFAEIAAPDMKTLDAKDAAGETEERLRIQLNLNGRDAVDLEALANAARQVAERLGLLIGLQRDPVFGER